MMRLCLFRKKGYIGTGCFLKIELHNYNEVAFLVEISFPEGGWLFYYSENIQMLFSRWQSEII